MFLSQLKKGESAKIADLHQMKTALRQRLFDFGFVEGEKVLFVRKMPFHGPVLININGQMIGIRENQAKRIGVEKI